MRTIVILFLAAAALAQAPATQSLFVVNKNGVPSVAKIFVLGDEVEKRVARG